MKTSLILGFFDGIHTAHKAVIDSALNYSTKNNTTPVLVTLKNSPAMYFDGIAEYIYPRKESLKIVKSLGVKDVIDLDFSEFANMTAEDYLNYLFVNYSPASISTGFNHTFGYKKSGSPEMLEKYQNIYNYKYICIDEQYNNGEVISSSLIKQYLKTGNIERANELLGQNFFIEGKVIKGNQIGRTIGFPTANIKYPENIVKIPFGVYYTELYFDGQKYSGVMNWGRKPTVNKTNEPVAEINIQNFNHDIYGQNIRINIIKKIRDEKKFFNLEELKEQIEKDVKECLKLS